MFGSPDSVRAALNRGYSVGSELTLHFSASLGIGFGGIRASEPPLQATELAELLMRQPRSLKKIMFYHVTLLGDLEPLLEALRQQQHFSYFFSQCGNFDQRQIIDGVKDIPSLEELVICGHSSPIKAELASLTDLLHRRPNLKTLDVGTIAPPPSDEAAAEFFQTAKNAPNLKRLEVYLNTSGLSSKQLEFVGDMLSSNAGGLEQLVVCASTSESLRPIAKGLVGNAFLKHLKIRLMTEPRGADLDAFAEAMNENLALRKLEVCKESEWNNEARRFDPIYLDSRVQRTVQKIDFYLTLNRMGRYHLLADRDHTATPEEWLQTIANKEDVSVIYYFARQNPLVCLPKSKGGICPEPTKQTKAQDDAQAAAKYRHLYGTGFFAESAMELRGSKNVKEALHCPIRPYKTLRIEFNHFRPGKPDDSTITASDLAALIQRAPMSLNRIMLYFVKIQGEFSPVIRAIRGKKLEHFFSQGSTFDADGLVKTLSDLPSFNSLSLTWAHPKITTLTELLAKRPNLTNLRVSGVPTPSENEAKEFFVAVGKARNLKNLELFWSGSHLDNRTVEMVGKMLANHSAIETLEIKVARNVSLAPLALGLHENKSLRDLTVSVDNLQPHNPVLNNHDITCFLNLLEKKNCSLKRLKVTNESWHGDHLWKPRYAQNPSTRSMLEKIQNLLEQNSRGRVLPVRVETEFGENVSEDKSKITKTGDRLASLEARLVAMSSELAKEQAEKVALYKRINQQSTQITALEHRLEQFGRNRNSIEQESSSKENRDDIRPPSSQVWNFFPLRMKLRRKKR